MTKAWHWHSPLYSCDASQQKFQPTCKAEKALFSHLRCSLKSPGCLRNMLCDWWGAHHMRKTFFSGQTCSPVLLGPEGVTVILRSYWNATVLKTQSFKEFLLLYSQKGG